MGVKEEWVLLSLAANEAGLPFRVLWEAAYEGRIAIRTTPEGWQVNRVEVNNFVERGLW